MNTTHMPRKYANPAVDAFSIGDKVYVLGSFEILPNGATTWFVFNKDIIEAEGLADPYELYFNGEWNWDNFREMAIALPRTLMATARPDQYGMENLYTWAYLVASNGVNFFVPNEEGRLIYNWNDEGVLRLSSLAVNSTTSTRLTPLLVDSQKAGPSLHSKQPGSSTVF